MRGELEDQSIRLLGRIESPAEFEQIVVRRRGNELLRLGQVASVADGFAEQTSYSIRNGHPNVGLSITRSRDASTVSVANDVRKLAAEIAKTLPEGTTLEITQDGGEEAQNSLDNVVHALVFGAGLTVLVVYIFLNSWRSTLITALSLPTSVVAAFIAVWLAGFTLNFMSLLGLSLAIGVLIDDAIVVRENIVRHMERGEDRRTAALNGTAEIGLAVAATTFSIVAVFAPVAFMPGVSGEWFRPFGITVVASVLVSLFISFTLDPMLSAYWGDPVGHHAVPRRGISLWLQRFNAWFDHQADRYGRVIAWALHHRRWMFLIALASLLGALGLQMKFGGSSFLPRSDAGHAGDRGARAGLVEPQLRARQGRGRRRRWRARCPRPRPPTVLSTPVAAASTSTSARAPRASARTTAIAQDLRALTARLVGAEYTVLEDFNMGAQKPVQIRFNGADSRKLLEITNAFMARLRQVPGAVDVGLSEQDPQDELKIELDRGLANALGISAADAAQALRVAFAGVEVGDWVDPTGETRDVAVRLAPEDRVDASNIERLPIAVAGGGRIVPLDQIATVTIGKGPSQIQHADGKRTIAVTANAQGRSSGEVTADALKIAKAIDFPPGYGIELAGASRDQQEVFREMTIALVMGVALMYLILVMQFGSFTAPLPVMLSLPLSLIGVVLALLATGGTLNLMSFIGVIMLMGLVAKNAILLLDATRVQEAAGRRARRGTDDGRPQAPAPDPDDHHRADRRHAAGGHRHRRGQRVLPTDGGGDHRRHHHLDAADAAGDPELLRFDRDLARSCAGQVPCPRAALESVLRLRRDAGRGAADAAAAARRLARAEVAGGLGRTRAQAAVAPPPSDTQVALASSGNDHRHSARDGRSLCRPTRADLSVAGARALRRAAVLRFMSAGPGFARSSAVTSLQHSDPSQRSCCHRVRARVFDACEGGDGGRCERRRAGRLQFNVEVTETAAAER